jgi:hypothetical protein
MRRGLPPPPARSGSRRSRAGTTLAGVALSLVLGACASSTSTSSFKGEEHAAAQAIANLQANATASEHDKICKNDLAASVVKGLGGIKGCETAVKNQLAEVENLEVTIQSLKIDPGGRTATATVKSTYSGKSSTGTLSLVKEGGSWRVEGVP